MGMEAGGAAPPPPAAAADGKHQHQHQHPLVGPWSIPRLALLLGVLLVDVGAGAFLFFQVPGLNPTFTYSSPGSATWDLWLLGLARCLLVLLNALAFDGYALTHPGRGPQPSPSSRKRGASNGSNGRRRTRGSRLVSGAGAGSPHDAVGSSNGPPTRSTDASSSSSSSLSSPSPAAAGAQAAKPAKRVSRLRRLEDWTRRAVMWGSGLSLLLVMSKCLVRLFCGIDHAEDRVAWFWLTVAFGALMSVVDYFAFKQHVRQVKRFLYWRHHPQMQQQQEKQQRRRSNGDDASTRDTLRESLLSAHERESAAAAAAAEEEEQEEGKNGNGIGGSAYQEEDVDEEEEVGDDGEHDLEYLWESIKGLDPEAEGKGKGHATFRDLLSLVRDDVHLISLAFVFLLGAAVGQVLIPHYTGKAIDAIVSEEGKASFQRAMLMLVLCAAVCGLCTGLRGGIFTVVGARVNRRLRDMLFQALLRQELGFFDTTKTGDISSRLSADTTKVGDQVSLNVNFFLRNLVQAVGTLVFLFLQSWKLSLVAFVSVPAIVVISRVYGSYIRKLSKMTQEKLAEANVIAEECLSTMATVRSFACEEEEGRLYKAKLDEYYGLNKMEARAYGAYAVATTMLPNMVIALVLFYGGQLVLNEDGMTSGKLVSFLLLLSSLSDAFNNMGSIFSAMAQALGAAEKVFELIKREPKVVPPPQPVTPAECRGEIEIRDVCFRYPARPLRPVLQGLSFQAKPGQVVALVGPSGGGKSSCIALLERYYEPEAGNVLLDGRPVRCYDQDWYHRHVSIVSQEPTLYARSIRQNIIFGLEGTPHEPSEEEIRRAAVLANAHDFITALPDGYETECGERGVALSGGQKQRIAIARALVRKPNVLLLDEATSALDAESEFQVQRAIDQMIERGGMTVVIVAHRLSTIVNADTILVVMAGQVVESGRHAELLAKGGVYAQLVQKQVDALDASVGMGLGPPRQP